MQSDAVWQILTFLLNSILFVLIGLQLPTIRDDLGEVELGRVVGYAAIVTGVVILTRIVWTYVFQYAPYFFRSGVNWRLKIRTIGIVAWMGMRGAVSLAAALALPSELLGRDLVVFLTFCVILGTLVVQGLTLPALIKVLKVGGVEDEDHEEEQEQLARIASATAALKRLRTNPPAADPEAIALVIAEYEDRLRRLHAGRASLIGEPVSRDRVLGSLKLRRASLDAERRTLLVSYRRRQLTRDLLVRLERELDLEESRLAASAGAANEASELAPPPETWFGKP